MHSKKSNSSTRVILVAFCISLILLCAAIAGIKVLTHTTPPNPTAITFVPQPPSAAQVAKSMNCVKFQDHPFNHASDQGYGTIDVGNCWIGNVKYAINTFPTSAVRDSWLKLAEPLGVDPKWETATAVIYPSVSNS